MNSSIKRNRNKKGGFVAFYNKTSSPNDYMLSTDVINSPGTAAAVSASAESPFVYFPPNADVVPPTIPTTETSSLNLYPNLTAGGGQRRRSRNCTAKSCDAFEFDKNDSFLYSLEGGCACNASSLMRGGNGDGGYAVVPHKANYGGARPDHRKGGAFVLTPFITAISLLAARLLADKNGPFPMMGGTERRRRTRK